MVVDFAIETNRMAKRAATEVEAIKPFMRDTAQAKATISGAHSVDLEGSLGVVQVVFPGPVLQAKKVGKEKAADLSQLESQLSPELFNSIFRKKTVVEFVDDAKGYQEKFAKLSAAQQNLLKNFVEVVDSTPRVNIGK